MSDKDIELMGIMSGNIPAGDSSRNDSLVRFAARTNQDPIKASVEFVRVTDKSGKVVHAEDVVFRCPNEASLKSAAQDAKTAIGAIVDDPSFRNMIEGSVRFARNFVVKSEPDSTLATVNVTADEVTAQCTANYKAKADKQQGR
jgi:hypothetical protein